MVDEVIMDKNNVIKCFTLLNHDLNIQNCNEANKIRKLKYYKIKWNKIPNNNIKIRHVGNKTACWHFKQHLFKYRFRKVILKDLLYQFF